MCGLLLLACSPARFVRSETLDPGFPEQPVQTWLTEPEVVTEREELTRWLDQGPFTDFYPGIGVAVVVNSQPVYIHYVNSGPDKAYGMASITKIFTGLAIMQLVDSGKLDLDQAVEDAIPGLKLQRVGLSTEAVRIRHLVSHLGGLPDLRYYHRDDYLSKEENPLDFRIPRPIYPPGQHYRYSNQGFMILGKVIEAARADADGEA